jgi:succinate dehydrogenase/fumarate reductase cytochrome b subunit
MGVWKHDVQVSRIEMEETQDHIGETDVVKWTTEEWVNLLHRYSIPVLVNFRTEHVLLSCISRPAVMQQEEELFFYDQGVEILLLVVLYFETLDF